MQAMAKTPEVENRTLKKYVAAYLKEKISQDCDEITNKIAAKLYLMSEITRYLSY